MTDAQSYEPHINDDHPLLNFFPLPVESEVERKSAKLYLIPSSFGESYDEEFRPLPSPKSELPDGERWTLAFVMSALEIIAGRRSIMQLARTTHRIVYNRIASKIGMTREVPKIRRFHRHEPIEGVIEVTVTLAFRERVRVLVARFEGVDRKWLCTEFEIL